MINGPLIALSIVFALMLMGQVLITLVFGRDRTVPRTATPTAPTNDAQPIVITLDPIDEHENPS
tara:strand:- start:189310 stop:189501 length:192 start_codon:yes stop_codon:yes gene_type:complete